jgi:hypothetical protein
VVEVRRKVRQAARLNGPPRPTLLPFLFGLSKFIYIMQLVH